MKEKIPFNYVYRQKVESGEYQVVTRDGRNVEIVMWPTSNHPNDKTYIIVDNLPFELRFDGLFLYGVESPIDLFILREKEKHLKEKKPKFKNGDLIVDSYGVVGRITKVLRNTYEVRTDDDCTYHSLHWQIDEECRLWSINDLRDGDIIHMTRKDNNDCQPGWIGVFKKLEKGKIVWSHVSLRLDGFFTPKGGYLILDDYEIEPATVRQKEIFFSKIKENGYYWDDDNKLLRKNEEPDKAKETCEWCEVTEPKVIETSKYLYDVINHFIEERIPIDTITTEVIAENIIYNILPTYEA